MAPAVLSTGVFHSKAPFHSKFQWDPPEISVTRVPSQPVNGNSRVAITKTIDLAQKILFHDGVRRGSKRTPLSTKVPCENLDVSSLKNRKLVFAPVWEASYWSVQTSRPNSVLHLSKIVQNENSGKTASKELASVKVTPIIATNGGSIQSLATHERSNAFDHHQNPDVSGSSKRDGEETSVLSPPESRSIDGLKQGSCTEEPGKGSSGMLLGAESSQPTNDLQRADPEEGPMANPQLFPVTSDECQASMNQYLISHAHTAQSEGFRNNQEWSKSPPLGTRNFYFRAIAKNLNVDGCISRDTSTEHSRKEVAAAEVHASSESEIPTVVQEFSGMTDYKRRATKRRNIQKKQRAGVAEKRARLDAVVPGSQTQCTPFAQFTGGKITVHSTTDGDDHIGPRASQSCQDMCSTPGLISLNGQGTSSYFKTPRDPKSSFGIFDDCCDPCTGLYAYSKSAYVSNGFAAERSQCLNLAIPAEGSKFRAETPQYLGSIPYSAAYLRSLVPYRPEGFNYPHMKFKCVFCSQLFPCHDDLQGHVDQKHYGNDPYECPFCFKRFNHTSTYSGHLNEHVQQQDYPTLRCRACSTCFSSRWEYDLHAMTH